MLILILIGTFACTKKDLELNSTQELATNYYKTDEQASAALVAAYDPIAWVWRQGFWGGSLKTWGNFASDDAYTGGSDPGDQPTYQAADIYAVSPSDPGANLTAFWGNYFQGIFRANLILDQVKPDDNVKKQAIAQAKFLKAFYYFYLSRMFGGLPLMDHVQLPTDETKRSSIDSTYTYIENLLIDVVTGGDIQQRSGGVDPSNGMATLGSARALLGKVYLYHKKYAEAISVLTDVATDNNYSLDPAFWHIFKGNNRHGMESIFELNFSSSIGAGNEGNSDVYLMGPRGGVNINDTIDGGWGFDQPTQALVDAFKEQNDNVRMQATVFFEDSLLNWYRKYVNNPAATITWVNRHDGYWDRKHYPDPNLSVANVHSRFSNPDVILRLGDVYLMLAEAYVRTGDADKAKTYINYVRHRAHLADLSTVTLVDVKKERRLELALEVGERYFDLVRWKGDGDGIDAENVLGPLGYSTGTPGSATKGLFPIPQGELDKTFGPNKLVQNPGY